MFRPSRLRHRNAASIAVADPATVALRALALGAIDGLTRGGAKSTFYF
jgi:hypothetical protein